MILLINEDGTMCVCAESTGDMKAAADDGLCDVIDVTSDWPYYWREGEWHKIEKFNPGDWEE